MRVVALLAGCLLASLHACSPAARERPVELRDLVLRDSTYFEPLTLEPYSGPVTSTFLTDPGRLQIEGEMQGGTWHGLLRVYHRDGRIRYEGRLERGARCGAWTENTDPRPTSNVYEDLVTLVETLAIYPECSEG